MSDYIFTSVTGPFPSVFETVREVRIRWLRVSRCPLCGCSFCATTARVTCTARCRPARWKVTKEINLKILLTFLVIKYTSTKVPIIISVHFLNRYVTQRGQNEFVNFKLCLLSEVANSSIKICWTKSFEQNVSVIQYWLHKVDKNRWD